MAARKKKSGHGGKRSGAGRPVGTGTGRGKNARHNRIAVMLSDKELRALKRLAKKSNMRLATIAYVFVASALDRSGALK